MSACNRRGCIIAKVELLRRISAPMTENRRMNVSIEKMADYEDQKKAGAENELL